MPSGLVRHASASSGRFGRFGRFGQTCKVEEAARIVRMSKFSPLLPNVGVAGCSGRYLIAGSRLDLFPWHTALQSRRLTLVGRFKRKCIAIISTTPHRFHIVILAFSMYYSIFYCFYFR
jgi:hypothetical protein